MQIRPLGFSGGIHDRESLVETLNLSHQRERSTFNFERSTLKVERWTFRWFVKDKFLRE
jgi:hypothetical protein